MNELILTDTYQQVAVGKTVFIGQARAHAEVFIGTAPTAASVGFAFKADTPQAIPDFVALGGEAWVRGTGTFVYVTD